MFKYYDENNELVLTSKKDNYIYMVTNNILNVGKRKSFHTDLRSATAAQTRAQREIQANIDYCRRNNYPQKNIDYYKNLFFNCRIVKLYKKEGK